MEPLSPPSPNTKSRSILSLFLFSLQLLWLSQPSSSIAHSNASSASCPHHQKAALLQLKNGFSIYRHVHDNSSLRLDSWNQATDRCSWEGITCDVATGLVIEVDLSNNNHGSISWIECPINSSLFFHLRSLQKLNLSSKNFHPNPIPSGLGLLTNLTHLDLSNCSFVGQIPLEISQLTKLVFLNLSGNGALKIRNPNLATLFRNFSNLEELFLDHVNISEHGGEWAHALSSALPNLRILSLGSCGLSGPSNGSLFKAPFLSQFSLDGNNLSLNTLLNLFDHSSSLSSLTLSDCGLCGKFPESVFLLPDLQALDISKNPFLTIDLPEFPKNSALQRLTMDNTNLQEKLPDSIGNLKFLEVLSLSNCNISGFLPSSIANLIHLEHLDLSSNNFQGPIARIIYNLVEIQFLDLSYNNFSGNIELQDMFQSFRNLQYLSLSGNRLSIMNNMASPNLILSSQIEDLRFSSCNISEFPNILRNLKSLMILDLSNNKIHGEIPSWIWRVVNATQACLNLSHNFLESFEHPMPDLSFSRLHYIDLHSNKLQGSIPSMPHTVSFQDYSKNNFSSIVPHETNLKFVYFFSLSDNNISGEIPLSVCNARNLQVLDLSCNKLSGRIPYCLGEISDSLEILNLQKNSFHGMLPQSFHTKCRLRTLNVQTNQLEGPLPRSLANCKKLEVLDLGNNKINDTFHFLLKDLSQLRILILRSNKFHGPIAHSHMNYPLFPFLQIFDISSNDFLGLFPSNLFLNWKVMMRDASHLSDEKIVRHQMRCHDGRCFTRGLYYQDSVTLTMKGLDIEVVKILTALISIDISNNSFEGRIEESIGNLKSLCVLNFSQNDFHGPIPPSLGKLTQLESLDLSRNKLSGEIPRQLLNLTFLEVFNLSQNLLIGSIPQGQQFSTFTKDSFLGNKGLCGPPLTTKCEDMGPSSPPDFKSFGSNNVCEIDWRMMWIGFGVGFGVGLGVVSWTLALWRKGSRKYNQFIDGVVHKFF